MKMISDVTLITDECTFSITKATELFIESLASDASLHNERRKKNSSETADVDAAIETVES